MHTRITLHITVGIRRKTSRSFCNDLKTVSERNVLLLEIFMEFPGAMTRPQKQRLAQIGAAMTYMRFPQVTLVAELLSVARSMNAALICDFVGVTLVIHFYFLTMY